MCVSAAALLAALSSPLRTFAIFGRCLWAKCAPIYMEERQSEVERDSERERRYACLCESSVDINCLLVCLCLIAGCQ